MRHQSSTSDATAGVMRAVISPMPVAPTAPTDGGEAARVARHHTAMAASVAAVAFGAAKRGRLASLT